MRGQLELAQQVQNIMAKIFQVRAEQITEQTSFGSIASWDSVNHVNLINELERQFKIRIDNDEFQQMVSFKVVCAVVTSHLEDEE